MTLLFRSSLDVVDFTINWIKRRNILRSNLKCREKEKVFVLIACRLHRNFIIFRANIKWISNLKEWNFIFLLFTCDFMKFWTLKNILVFPLTQILTPKIPTCIWKSWRMATRVYLLLCDHFFSLRFGIGQLNTNIVYHIYLVSSFCPDGK